MAELSDPIDIVRDARHKISERVGHDPARLVAYYIELQREFRGRMLVEEPTPWADEVKEGPPPPNPADRR
jgi:hypothetical protein